MRSDVTTPDGSLEVGTVIVGIVGCDSSVTSAARIYNCFFILLALDELPRSWILFRRRSFSSRTYMSMTMRTAEFVMARRDRESAVWSEIGNQTDALS